MDQMCSKREIHCFSHELWKISEVPKFRKFPKHFFCTSLFGKNCQKKFRTAMFGHSEFIPVFLGKMVGKNLEWPFLAFLNLYLSFLGKIVRKNLEWPFLAILNFSVHITLIECNGLESNEICTFLGFYSEI